MKSFEILTKHSVYSFIPKFYVKLVYFCSINKQKLLLPLWCRCNTNILFDCVKLIQGIFFLVNVVSSNPLSLILLSTCTDELISDPKIMTFLPMLSSVNKHSEEESYPIP